MSKPMPYGDFAVARERAMHQCYPMPYRSQQAWLGDWIVEAHRMHYLETQSAELSEMLRTLIRIRAKLKKPNLSLEFIKPDVENLWIGLATGAKEAGHVIQDTENGFECAFYAVVNDGYITGSVTVSRHS